ncbi:MAG: cation transporter [Eggerthellaceae bacterium]
MTCAACAARVDRRAQRDGVKDVAVNLLKNSMEVTYADDAPAAVARANAAVCAAVDHAGYAAAARRGHTPSVAAGQGASPQAHAADEEAMRTRLSIGAFTVPLFYLSIDTCSAGRFLRVFWETPLFSPWHSRSSSSTERAVRELRYFENGSKPVPALEHDPIALGSAASAICGIASVYGIGVALGLGRWTRRMRPLDRISNRRPILTLITLGKYFEAREG